MLDALMDDVQAVRVRDLEDRIRKARDAYYNHAGDPHAPGVVSDDVYDAWVDELASLQPSNSAVTSIGAPVPVTSKWVKVAHEIPMGSLNKVNTLDEFTRWASKVSESDPLSTRFLVSEKMDGISINLRYVHGAFARAVTRGDGIEGEDITQNVTRMKGIPARLPMNLTASFRGEILIKKSDFPALGGTYTTMRNAAAGVAKRFDGVGCEHLTVCVYRAEDVVFPEGAGLSDFLAPEAEPEVDSDADRSHLRRESEGFELLTKLGFHVPNWYLTAMVPGVRTPHDLWVEYQQSKRDQLDYEIDGLVVSVDDLETQMALGSTDNRPEGAVAFKFAPVTRETRIKDIVWQTGPMGVLTPVAEFDAVQLLGASVSKASLYNHKYIQDLAIDVGSVVLVARSNDVIPRVVARVKGPSTIASAPTTCVSCGGHVGQEGEYWVCLNVASCPAQTVGRLRKYVREIGVLEWGEGILDKLCAAGLVKSVPDLYRLTTGQIASLPGLGEKSAENLHAALWDRNPIPLDQLVGGMAIPGCSTATVQMIMSKGYNSLSALREVSYESLLEVRGLGEVKARAFTDWMWEHGAMLSELEAVGVNVEVTQGGQLVGKTVCFTGTMRRKRDDLREITRRHGGVMKPSVTKTLDILVMADVSSGSTKAKAAKKNGTQCMTEEAFLSMLGEQDA